MQQTNPDIIKFIGDISRYSLIGLLAINILSPFFILFINPEAFFVGQKIAGTPAMAYALVLILVTALVMFCLYNKTEGYALIALAYGGFSFINGYLSVVYYNSQVPTLIHWLFLLLSVILYSTGHLTRSGKPAVPYEKNAYTLFSENPRTGLLLSASVIVCFLLVTSIGFITYQKEYNTYVYRIEINPDTTIYNVTLIVPLPSGFSRNIMGEDLAGSSSPYFTNYSQSVIETENGTMIKITADSIERPGQGVTDGPLQLYYSTLAEVAGSSLSLKDNQPLLMPEGEFFLPTSCSDMQFQGALAGNSPMECSRYESGMFAKFETNQVSKTIFIVSLDHTRIISSSQSPRRDAFQEYITATIFGSADGWYDTEGFLLATVKA